MNVPVWVECPDADGASDHELTRRFDLDSAPVARLSLLWTSWVTEPVLRVFEEQTGLKYLSVFKSRDAMVKWALSERDRVREYLPTDGIPPVALEKIARLSCALSEWIAENGLDAIAVQCWTALERIYGIVPCATTADGEARSPIRRRSPNRGSEPMSAVTTTASQSKTRPSAVRTAVARLPA